MAIDPAGNIYVAGHFTDANGKYFVAKWNGTGWSQVGTGSNGLNADNMILALTTDAAGNVYAAGMFKNGQPRNNFYVSKWDGTRWQEIRNDSSYLNANAAIRAIAVDAAGNVYAGGSFTYSPSPSVGKCYVAKWDGKKWAELGGVASLQANAVIRSIACDQAGNVYTCGAFSDTAGKVYLAKWDGTAWSSVGKLPNTWTAGPNTLHKVTTDKVGNVYTAGSLADSNGMLYVARWNGTKWSEVASKTSNLGVAKSVYSDLITMAVSPNGVHVYAAGIIPSERTRVIIMHWDGVSWSELGKAPYTLSIGHTGTVWQLAVNPTGEVVATGDFTDPAEICYVAKCGNYNLSVPNAGNSATTSIKVYPNPCNGHFTISGQCLPAQLGNDYLITLTNMLGQVVYTEHFKPENVSWTINVQLQRQIADGLYQLQIISKDMKYSQAILMRNGR
jgi:hypothetical protein